MRGREWCLFLGLLIGCEPPEDPGAFAAEPGVDIGPLPEPLPRAPLAARIFDPSRPLPPPVTCPIPGANDSDRDGLADLEETLTDSCLADTDGDGIGDLVEVAFDPACAIDAACAPGDWFHAYVLPQGTTGALDVRVDTRPRRVDVLVLAEGTEALAASAEPLRRAFAPGGFQLLDPSMDAFIGLAFAHGLPETADDPPPLQLVLPPSPDGVAIVSDSFAMWRGRTVSGKAPVSALAIREALTRPSAFAFAGCGEDRFGGACWREDAQPVIVHVATEEAPWRDSPLTLGELRSVFEYSGARYVGVHVGESACASPGCPTLIDLGKEVGSVDLEERSLVADLAGRSDAEMRSTIGALVRRAVEQTRTRVWTRLEAPSALEIAMRPCTDRRPEAECVLGRPGIEGTRAFLGTSGGSYRGVVPGTAVAFTITIENRTLGAAARSQHVTVPVSARGDGRALLDEVDLHVLVPAAP